MNGDALELKREILQYRLHWRHPKTLEPVLRQIERGRMLPRRAKRWRKRIEPWIRQQEQCFNPYGPAPSQEELGRFDIELGHLIEAPAVRVGVRVSSVGHILCTGTTGSGKSNILRNLINGLDAINRRAGTTPDDPDS